jgi:hypothetical protein
VLSLEEIDRLQSPAAISDHEHSLEAILAPIVDKKDPEFRAKAARLRLLRGYCLERLGQLQDALDQYNRVAGSDYTTVALFRVPGRPSRQGHEVLPQASRESA